MFIKYLEVRESAHTDLSLVQHTSYRENTSSKLPSLWTVVSALQRCGAGCVDSSKKTFMWLWRNWLFKL